jgi:hypothetical protein
VCVTICFCVFFWALTRPSGKDIDLKWEPTREEKPNDDR